MERDTRTNGQDGGPQAATLRINKALADAGVCSRRAADALVAAGRVTVNGAVLDTPGARIDPERDRVAVDGRHVSVPVPGQREHAYVLLNKPPGVVTTASDPQGRRTVLDLVGERFGTTRLFPVGRLDFFSQGLILLTDDGELANRMTHPSHHLPKVYHATVRGTVAPQTLEAFARGVTLAEGEALAPVPTRVLRTVAGTTTLEMTLIQGVNRQIRRMCRDVGLTVLRLTRVSQGPLDLDGLAEGEFRVLSAAEADALLRAAGLAAGPEKPARPRRKGPGPGGAKKAPGRPRGRKKS